VEGDKSVISPAAEVGHVADGVIGTAMKPLMPLYWTEWRERDYGLWYVLHTLCTLHEQYCIMHVLVLSIVTASTDDIYKFRFISVYISIRLLACRKTSLHTSYSFSKVYHAKKQMTSKN
jgi:hypothetical protein